MTDTAPIKFTLKSGPGYEAPWATIEGNNPDEIKSRLLGCIESGVFPVAAEASAAFVAAYGLGATRVETPAPAPAQDAPAWASRATDPAYQQQVHPSAQALAAVNPIAAVQVAQAQPAQGGAPSCPHGQMEWKQGVGKASGKPYKGWFCGARVQGCEPQFVR